MKNIRTMLCRIDVRAKAVLVMTTPKIQVHLAVILALTILQRGARNMAILDGRDPSSAKNTKTKIA